MRATISSTVATIVDGVIYQLVLTVASGRFALAAAAAAVLGALTNFTLNRMWAFPPGSRTLTAQLALYVLGSVMTYGMLQLSLWILIERLAVNARIAWIPAKVVAWSLVSYPFQRIIVFARRPS